MNISKELLNKYNKQEEVNSEIIRKQIEFLTQDNLKYEEDYFVAKVRREVSLGIRDPMDLRMINDAYDNTSLRMVIKAIQLKDMNREREKKSRKEDIMLFLAMAILAIVIIGIYILEIKGGI